MGWEVLLLITGTALVSTGCLVPASWLPPLPNDKLLHFLAFGGLALLATRMSHNVSEQATALIIVFMIGLGIEILQNSVPGRKFCWRDLAANTAGILSAACCSKIIL